MSVAIAPEPSPLFFAVEEYGGVKIAWARLFVDCLSRKHSLEFIRKEDLKAEFLLGSVCILALLCLELVQR